MTDISEGGVFATPRPRAAPKRPILDEVNLLHLSLIFQLSFLNYERTMENIQFTQNITRPIKFFQQVGRKISIDF